MRTRSKLTTTIVGAGVIVVASIGAATAAIPGYRGLEGKAPATYPAPVAKSGFKCVIGYQNPLAANEFCSTCRRAPSPRRRRSSAS